MTRALSKAGPSKPLTSPLDGKAGRRVALPVADLSDREMALIRAARVETGEPYTLDDIPDAEAP